MTMSAVTSVLATVLVFITREQPDKYPRFGFGWEWRTGAILVVPLVGEFCRRSLFDNDSGAIWPVEPVSCADVFDPAINGRASRDIPTVMAISQNFRR
jgi:hypothetical protein